MLIKINYSSLLVKSTFFLLTLHRLCGTKVQGEAYLYAVSAPQENISELNTALMAYGKVR